MSNLHIKWVFISNSMVLNTNITLFFRFEARNPKIDKIGQLSVNPTFYVLVLFNFLFAAPWEPRSRNLRRVRRSSEAILRNIAQRTINHNEKLFRRPDLVMKKKIWRIFDILYTLWKFEIACFWLQNPLRISSANILLKNSLLLFAKCAYWYSKNFSNIK